MGAGASIAFEGAETGCATECATVITFVNVGEEVEARQEKSAGSDHSKVKVKEEKQLVEAKRSPGP